MQLRHHGFREILLRLRGRIRNSAAEYIVPEVRAPGAGAAAQDLDLLDRYLVYPVAIALMRERLLMLPGASPSSTSKPDWGPGRVDTFNSAKVLFNFPMDKLPDARAERRRPTFPRSGTQGPRKGMQLHWDGNNTMVEERNKSAAFGTGTTPPTLDLRSDRRASKSGC